MISFEQFAKKFFVYRKEHLNKFHEGSEISEFPKYSALHLFDNSIRNENIDGVPLNTLPFNLGKIKTRKELVSPELNLNSGPFKASEKYTFLSSGIQQSFQEYRKENIEKFKIFTLKNSEAMSFNQNTLSLFNYNHLFRLKVRGGKIASFRKFNLILSSIFNEICSLPENLSHYFFFPLSERNFTWGNFSSAKTGFTDSTLKFKDNYHYLFLVHLLFFFSDNRDKSIFDKFPSELFPSLNLLLYSGEKFVIYNFDTLLEMAEKDSLLSRRILAQSNILSKPDEEEDSEEESIVYDETIDEKVLAKKTSFDEDGGNETKAKGFETEKDLREQEEKLLVDINIKASQKIKEANITPKQKKRMEKISKKYTELELDGVKLTDILLKQKSPKLDSGYISSLENSVPEKSMLKSSVTSFDKEYIEKTLEPDLVNALVSFNQQGMFLTGLKKEYIVDELNRKSKYRVTFTDLDGRRHTSTFEVPLIEPDGKYLINGSYKYFKKQPVNLPICKISETRVSLSSSYNKALVERNTNVANSFSSYIEKICEKILKNKPQKIRLIRGTSAPVKRPTSYEYTCACQKFQKISANFSTPIIFNFTGEFKDIGEKRNIVIIAKKFLTSANKKKLDKGQKIVIDRKYTEMEVKKNTAYWLNSGHTVFINLKGDKTELVPLTEKELSKRDLLFKLEIDNASILVGHDKRKTVFFFLEESNFISTLDSKGEYKTHKNSLVDFLCHLDCDTKDFNDALDEPCSCPINPLREWVHINILSKSIPMGFMLCYRYGLMNMLNYLGVDYKVYEGSVPKKEQKATDLVLRFKDKSIKFNRYPLVHSWIFGGLLFYNLKEFELELFESKEVYYSLFDQKGISINYIKGIDSFYDLFLSPVTVNVLEQMGEPTNMRDLFIRSVNLLTTVDHRPPPSMANFRFRSYERVPSFVYNEFARRFAAYQTEHSPAKKFTINPNAVYQKIIGDAASDSMLEISNPIHQIKQNVAVTYAGMGGRTGESFTIKDRVYPEDGIGILSEATADSGKVGFNSYLTMDPSIVNTRGIVEPVEDVEKLESTQLLSPTSCLMPGATNDDKLYCPFY